METIITISLALAGLFLIFLLLRKSARQSLIKSSSYLHKSELEPPEISYAMDQADINREEKTERVNTWSDALSHEDKPEGLDSANPR